MTNFYRLTISNHDDAFVREQFGRKETLALKKEYEEKGYTVRIEQLPIWK